MQKSSLVRGVVIDQRGPAFAFALLVACTTVASCNGAGPPPVAGSSKPLILDDAHGGSTGLYFLPPMVPEPVLHGTFAADLAPVVRIDELSGPSGDLLGTLATYTMTSGPGSETVRLETSQYIVNWQTDEFVLDAQHVYRIQVVLDGRVLGAADVQPVATGGQMKNVDTDLYVPLVDGRTLPIKFFLNRCAPVVCPTDQCKLPGVCNGSTGECSYENKPDGTACDDANACLQTDTCQAGTCVGSNPALCTASDQCHLAGECNPATGLCSDPEKGDGATCDDGSACTQMDVCDLGICVGQDPISCVASDQCHLPGTCYSATGTCSDPVAPDGTRCSDGNGCTQDDLCATGACVGSNPVVCAPDPTCETQGSCDPGSGLCSAPSNCHVCGNGTQEWSEECDDGNTASGDGCNADCQTEYCGDGIVGRTVRALRFRWLARSCGLSPVADIAFFMNEHEVARVPLPDTCDCQPGAQAVAVIDPALLALGKNGENRFRVGTTGELAWAAVQVDTPSGGLETMLWGAGGWNGPEDLCGVAQAEVDHDVGLSLAGGEECDDGNSVDDDACSNACTWSKCRGVVCQAQDQCHDAGTCDPATGICTNPTKVDGSACNDGSACTQQDRCQSGLCVGSEPVTCTAIDQCHVAGSCDPDTGLCSNPAAPDGTTCNDNDLCTQTDACQGGSCVGGDPVTCSALDQCHLPGTCDSVTGTCTNPISDDGIACSDGDACTTDDACQAGACVGGAPVTCAALDQCHVPGTCDTATGTCSNPAKEDGAGCNDGNGCTIGDSCNSGSCTAGSPVTCTASDACHLAGTCNMSTGVCSNPVAPNGTTCNDGNGCTRTDTCQSGSCLGSSPVACLAPDQCHQTGTCVPSTGACSYAPKTDGSACNDSDLCTLTDTCQSGLCVGSNPVICTGGNACQSAGVCDPSSGNCLRPGKPNGTACDDGDASTGSDSCQMGVCMGIPSLPSSTVSTTASSLGFIYQGAGASQIGVASGTIDARRAAGVRGKVLGVDGAPLAGVKVTIADHAEYGYAASGEDGLFQVVVNGGGSVVVRLSKGGYLRAERGAEVPWQGYAELEPVVLAAADPNPTLVTPGQGNLQVAQGAPISDGDGNRQAVLAFPSGTTASMVLANGTRVAMGSLRVRVTEVTVGDSGLAAMPAPLPATTAYTYAVDYSVDEALTSGNRRVEFNKPIYHYSENFLGFPVGGNVPSAYYDEASHRWVPSTDGRVIKVLGVAGGQAVVDVDGAGTPADATVLAAMKFSAEELAMLAGRYTPGTTLWRVPIDHFCTWDFNWPWCTHAGASNPQANMSSAPSTSAPQTSCGSIIENENQVVGERVAIPGTPFSLNYRSNRTPGYKAANELFVKLLGATTPPTLSEVLVRANVAGQSQEASLTPAPNLGYRYLWDGKDAFGRPVNGVARPEIMVGFRYPLIYTPPPADVNLHIDQVSFGELSANPLVEAAKGRMDVVSWQRLRPADMKVGTFDARGVGIGGWTIDVHHTLDSLKNMWLGDGGRRDEAITGSQTIVSSPPWGSMTPQDKLTVANDGMIYIGTHPLTSSGPSNAIYRVNPTTKQVSLFFSLQSLPAPLGCNFMHVTALDAGPDGNIYFSAYPACLGWSCGSCQYAQLAPHIFKLSPGGTLLGYWKVGDFAGWTAYTGIPIALRVAPDGTIYYLEARQVQGNPAQVPTCLRVMKLEANGATSVIAGGDCATTVRSQDPGPAASASFAAITNDLVVAVYSNSFAAYLALGRDGSLYVANYSEKAVRKISPDGWITTFAGGAAPIPGVAHAGDGGPATQAVIVPTAVAVDGDDTVYIGDFAYSGARDSGEIRYFGNPRGRVRAVKQGTIRTVLGSSNESPGPDGTPALQTALFSSAYGLALGPDGAMYVLDSGATAVYWNNPTESGTLRKFAMPLPWVGDVNATVVSEDGSEVYAFDSQGRHVATRNALTSGTKYTFSYSPAGRLAAITDANNLPTQIERDAESGQATAIVAPNGQRTELTVNANGYLEAIDEPGGIHRGFTYGSEDAEGLLASYENPRGQTSSFTYDDLGRVTGESMPGGCSWNIQRLTGPTAESPQTPVKVALTSAEGRTRSYQLGSDASNLENRAMVSAAGLTTQSSSSRAGVETTTAPDGMVTTVTKGADSQFGLQTPIAASTVVRTPAGKQMSLASSNSVTLDGARNLVSRVDTTSINGKATTTTYNAAARTRTTVSPLGRQTVTTLDAQGRPVQVQAGNLAPTAYGYDARGRLGTVTVGSGTGARVTTFGYDELDRLNSVTDPLTRTQQYIYDDANRVVGQIFPDTNQVAFGYDANGNVTSVTPPSRPAHAFGFTPNDLMSSYTPPAVAGTGATTYEYNLDKQVTVIHRPDGSQIVFTYDSAGRLTTTTYPKGPEVDDGTITVTRTYNPTTGKLATVSTSDGQTITYGYDGPLLLSTTWSGNVAGSVSRTYNNDFRAASESVNGASSVAFGYDNDGLLTSADGLSIMRDPTNGVVTDTTMGQVTDHRTYDSFGMLTTYEARFGTTSLYSVAHVRDALGRVEQKTETIQGTTTVWNYSYDSAGRLWQVMQNGVLSATYLYDANGNRQSKTTSSGTEGATYDDQDRLLTYGKWAYTYTANGELLTKTDTINGQLTRYGYDGAGNLRKVALPDGRVIEYAIDAASRRISKEINGAAVKSWIYRDRQITQDLDPNANSGVEGRHLGSNAMIETTFLLTTSSRQAAGLQVASGIAEVGGPSDNAVGGDSLLPGAIEIAAELDGSGAVSSRFLGGDYLAKGATTYRMIRDHLGGVRLVVSTITGQIAQQIDYDEFGNILADTNPGFQPLAFAGGIRDPDVGLLRFGARDYDATTGRWTAKDPLLLAGGDTSLYGYTLGDPVNGRDLSGEAAGNGPITFAWCTSQYHECMRFCTRAKKGVIGYAQCFDICTTQFIKCQNMCPR